MAEFGGVELDSGLAPGRSLLAVAHESAVTVIETSCQVFLALVSRIGDKECVRVSLPVQQFDAPERVNDPCSILPRGRLALTPGRIFFNKSESQNANPSNNTCW